MKEKQSIWISISVLVVIGVSVFAGFLFMPIGDNGFNFIAFIFVFIPLMLILGAVGVRTSANKAKITAQDLLKQENPDKKVLNQTIKALDLPTLGATEETKDLTRKLIAKRDQLK